MPVPLPEELLDDLKCSSCGHFLSVGPITNSHLGHHCGRCPNESADKNFLYETLARAFLFPCKYKESGCDILLPFGMKMKVHEATCGRRPYHCPIVPLEKCEWRGSFDEIAEHLSSSHGEFVLKELTVEVNLKGKTERRYACFCENGALYLIDLVNFEGKGLSVEVMRVLTDQKDVSYGDRYEIVLYSANDSGMVTFPRKISNYVLNSNFLRVANDLIDSNLLKYIGGEDQKLTIHFKVETPKVTLTHQESIVDVSVSNFVFLPCKNRAYGCNYMNYFPQTQKHEADCATYECPLKSQKCNWRGLMDRLEPHCLKDHEVATNTLVVDLKEIAPNGKHTFFFLLKSMVYGLFRVCIKIENYEPADTLMHTVVQCLNNTEEVGNYVFEVMLFDSAVSSKKCFTCGPYTSDEDAFEYCAHFYYDRLKESKANFTVRRRSP